MLLLPMSFYRAVKTVSLNHHAPLLTKPVVSVQKEADLRVRPAEYHHVIAVPLDLGPVLFCEDVVYL